MSRSVVTNLIFEILHERSRSALHFERADNGSASLSYRTTKIATAAFRLLVVLMARDGKTRKKQQSLTLSVTQNRTTSPNKGNLFG